MKLAQTLLAASVLLFLLTWLWLKGSTTEASSAAASLDALNDFSIAQSALHRDLLSARVGLLRNYDPLTQQTAALREATARLHDMTSHDAPLASAVARLDTLVQSQERWTEQFKTQNALLQNSLAYFSLFSGQLEDARSDAARRATALATAMLRLTLDTSTSAANAVDAHLQEISMSRLSEPDIITTRALLAHAKLLRDLLPQTDATLKALFSLTTDMHLESIRSLVAQRQQQAERKAQRFRYLLFATSLALAAALVYLGRRLQARSRALRKRAQMDRVLARMSTRFVGSRPEEMAGIVEQGLGDVAGCWGADRAYFVSVAPDADPPAPLHIYKWNRADTAFPPEWTAPLEGGTPPAPDLRGRLEVTSEGRTANSLLGLDFVRSAIGGDSNETDQLHMACDAIANAMERDFLERERVQLEAHLQQARRMETIGALASGVAHNFNNIIGAILGFAESAQSRPTSDPRMTEDIGEIQRAGGRARDLIDQLLTFGRRSSILRTAVQLDALVLESKRLLQASLPSTVRIVVREPFIPIVVAGTPAQLQQVILNVANNAAQAMDLVGSIDITLQVADVVRVEQLNVGELQPGRYGVLTIGDTGRGMDAAVRERIFDPFFTTRDAGNGLGLATVREIVLEHGGGLNVHSTPRVGTHFEIWLPADATIRPSSTVIADTTARDMQGNGETILVLDPDRARLLMHEDVLAALGYEPAGFTDADAAIAACTQDSERFDAALLYHQTNGEIYVDEETSISARLHAAAPRLPIILATSSARDLQAPSLAGSNVVAIVGQPPALAELAGSLARTLRR